MRKSIPLFLSLLVFTFDVFGSGSEDYSLEESDDDYSSASEGTGDLFSDDESMAEIDVEHNPIIQFKF